MAQRRAHIEQYSVTLFCVSIVFLDVTVGRFSSSALWCKIHDKTMQYSVQPLHVDEFGCPSPISGDSPNWPGAPRDLRTERSGCNFTLRWKLPDDASANEVEGFKIKLYLQTNQLHENLGPKSCYFINVSSSLIEGRNENTELTVWCGYRLDDGASLLIVVQSLPTPTGTHDFKEANDTIDISGCTTGTTYTYTTKPEQQETKTQHEWPRSTAGPSSNEPDMTAILTACSAVSIAVVVTAVAFLCYKRRQVRTSSAAITSRNNERDSEAIEMRATSKYSPNRISYSSTSTEPHDVDPTTTNSPMESRPAQYNCLPDDIRRQIIDFNELNPFTPEYHTLTTPC